eukprot:TRINITY_DN5612_c0_g1_i2.p2 TRINITY_DN5612_c0_g1~~TRINITY_DN5612_c0_g1_i2.p2  ORF type:complete len:131 (-),score=41.57 TRINITY_DN5612_c0_g1_i2:76-447(-)
MFCVALSCWRVRVASGFGSFSVFLNFSIIFCIFILFFFFFFFQAEDGIRDVERSRGLGDVYKRQIYLLSSNVHYTLRLLSLIHISEPTRPLYISYAVFCLKKKKKKKQNKNTKYNGEVQKYRK